MTNSDGPSGNPPAPSTTPPTPFESARLRVSARQHARRSAAQSALRARDDAHRPYVSRLPVPLQPAGRSALAAAASVRATLGSRLGTGPAFRVGQVDAELLDAELLELMVGQVAQALRYGLGGLRGLPGLGALSQGGVGDEYGAEIRLLLRALLWKLSLWDRNVSYGAGMMGLKYVDGRTGEGGIKRVRDPTAWQKAGYGAISVFGRYGWAKWEDWLVGREGGYQEPSPPIRTLSRLTSLLSSTHSLLALLSFVIFLINGRYRTLLDRLLQLRLVTASSHVSRKVSFEYLNRQLVWHAFTEFLLFVLPLVGISRWRRWINRAWRRTKRLVKSRRRGRKIGSDGVALGDEDGDGEDEDDEEQGELAFLPERTCAICYADQNPSANATEQDALAAAGTAGGGVVGSAQTDVTNPYETAPCGHVYCFVCIATRIEAEEGAGWTCLRCAAVVRECRPWKGDVIEEASRPGTGGGAGKSVSFVEGHQEMGVAGGAGESSLVVVGEDGEEEGGFGARGGGGVSE